jgi:hypothetical protein
MRDSTSGEPKRVERGGGTLKGDLARFSGSRRRRRSLSTFWDAGADAAGINEPAVVRVVAKQKRAERRARSFRIGPADDYEFLPVKAFGFAPEAAIAGCIGRSAAFDTMPSKPSLQAWLRMSSPSPVS